MIHKEGKYVVIEGTDGTGKSTQVEMLADRLQERSIETVQFHEPDGVEIASEIRSVIKNGNLARSAFTNVLLFTASRRENWLQKGLPVLQRGGWVLSARDYTSTLVYQGLSEGLELGKTTEEDLTLIEDITLMASDIRYLNPDHKIILDIDDEEERAERIAARGEIENPDTFESRGETFQNSVIEGYRKIANRRNIPIISAEQSLESIHDQIWNIVR